MNKEQFCEYVMDFYGPQGIYPMGATLEQVKEATELLLQRFNAVSFDSLDRERVRDILIHRFDF